MPQDLRLFRLNFCLQQAVFGFLVGLDQLLGGGCQLPAELRQFPGEIQITLGHQGGVKLPLHISANALLLGFVSGGPFGDFLIGEARIELPFSTGDELLPHHGALHPGCSQISHFHAAIGDFWIGVETGLDAAGLSGGEMGRCDRQAGVMHSR